MVSLAIFGITVGPALTCAVLRRRFPSGVRPTRLSLQSEAIGMVSIVASEAFPATPGMSLSGRLCPLPLPTIVVDREDVERQVTDLLRSYSRSLYKRSLKDQKRPEVVIRYNSGSGEKALESDIALRASSWQSSPRLGLFDGAKINNS
jgi:hypothetical protein